MRVSDGHFLRIPHGAEWRRRSLDTPVDTDMNPSKTSDVIENKKKAIELKEKGNYAFKKKQYEVAEKFYSEALELNPDSRPLWTNRAACRNTMKKHEDALTDCISALSMDSKNTKKGIQTDVLHLHSH